ncbi:MAG: alginate export family protein, partial [Candidatus Hydrogenedens sp.]
MIKKILLTLFIISFLSVLSYGELVSVEIGGKLEIYGLYYHGFIEPSDRDRIPSWALSGRTIGPDGTYSAYRTGSDSTGSSYVEQRTRLHTRAMMTDNVSAFIELDSIDSWGEDFRSQDYLTGRDNRGNTIDDIELFQAYIQCKDIGTEGLTLTIGRQAIDLGSGWLVGSDPGPNPFTGLSFDAIRLQYEQESYILDVFYAKLLESMNSFNHNDVDFAGMYFTWKEIIEGSSIDLYYFLLRDNRKNEVTYGDIFLETFERILDRDNPSTTYINTIGVRFFGEYNSFDYEVEFAYQWGESSAFGNLYVPVDGIYGDSGADWALPAGHFEVGYTIDEKKWTPRVYIGGCYYGAEDNRSFSFVDWLTGIGVGEASPSFNRLFTATREDNFIDLSGMTNFWQLYSGISVAPIEKVEVGFEVAYLQTVSAFDRPYSFTIGNAEFYPLSPFSFLTRTNSKDIGWQTLLSLTYQYSENLSFETGWSHFFIGD